MFPWGEVGKVPKWNYQGDEILGTKHVISNVSNANSEEFPDKRLHVAGMGEQSSTDKAF